MCGIDNKVALLRRELDACCRRCDARKDYFGAVDIAREIQLLDAFMQNHYRLCAACEEKAQNAMEKRVNG